MLTDAQAHRLQSCARVLGAPALIVVVGHGDHAATDALVAAVPGGVEVVAVTPKELDRIDGPIDILVIGRTGRYSEAVEALERWGTRVVPGGVLFVHGAFVVAPVTAALLRSIGTAPAWRYAGREGALAEYTRADLTRGERALDSVAQLAQLPAFARAATRRRLARLRSP